MSELIKLRKYSAMCLIKLVDHGTAKGCLLCRNGKGCKRLGRDEETTITAINQSILTTATQTTTSNGRLLEQRGEALTAPSQAVEDGHAAPCIASGQGGVGATTNNSTPSTQQRGDVG